jgi:probable F420-dependent oxidoreductase
VKPRFRVGVQLHPQHTTVEDLRDAWRRADSLGVDSLWLWDHFFPLYPKGGPYLWPPADDLEGSHFEAWSLLAAMATDTAKAQLGVLISNIHFRNPDLVADMARTVDHLSGGRLVLGVGAGNIERDFREYGYPFAGTADRLKALEAGIGRIKTRLTRLTPAPVGNMRLLIGGSGMTVTLRLVAQYADMWNSFGPPEDYARQNAALDEWCRVVGRDPRRIERTVLLDVPQEAERLEDFLKAGVEHVILGCGQPFDLRPAQELLNRARNSRLTRTFV